VVETERVQGAILFSEKLLGIAIETIGAANVSLSHLGARDPRDLIRQSESRFPDSKKLHVDKTARGSAVELAYATFGQLSLEAAHPTITALGRHLHSELEGDTRHLVIECRARCFRQRTATDGLVVL